MGRKMHDRIGPEIPQAADGYRICKITGYQPTV